jgi:hypothetical protein
MLADELLAVCIYVGVALVAVAFVVTRRRDGWRLF